MAELYQLQEQEIPEAMSQLQESYKNLSKVADYCEGFYLSTENKEKRAALEQTRGYTTQALASVAYQINTLATSFLSLLDLQANQLVEMESNINHLAQTVSIQKEKVARREIGVLTTNKSFYRPIGVKSPGIIFPEQSEKPIKYMRKPIDFTILDSIGQGGCKRGHVGGTLPRPESNGSSRGSLHHHNGPNNATVSNTLQRRGTGDSHGAPRVNPPTVPEYMSAHQLQQMSQRTARGDPGYSSVTNVLYSHGANVTPVPPLAPPMNPSMMGPPYNGLSPPSPPLPPMPTADELSMPPHSPEMPAPPSPPPPPATDMPPAGLPGEYPPPDYIDDDNESSLSASDRSTQRESIPPPPPPVNQDPDPTWAPQNYMEKVVAIYDYEPQNEDELRFRDNTVIYVINKNSDGWWEGVMELNGQPLCGLFPENYVEPLL